uniref:Uncharacterized protein n=1 Tax=Arundo donax TaxID=35708 RepID=A0A0A9UMR3_ARUDO
MTALVPSKQILHNDAFTIIYCFDAIKISDRRERYFCKGEGTVQQKIGEFIYCNEPTMRCSTPGHGAPLGQTNRISLAIIKEVAEFNAVQPAFTEVQVSLLLLHRVMRPGH